MKNQNQNQSSRREHYSRRDTLLVSFEREVEESVGQDIELVGTPMSSRERERVMHLTMTRQGFPQRLPGFPIPFRSSVVLKTLSCCSPSFCSNHVLYPETSVGVEGFFSL